ncbi:MAG: DUF3822 family protein [Ferruginibacter sp.]
MKTAFFILPEGEKQHVLLEAGTDGFACIFFTRDPFCINGASVYDFSNDVSPLSLQGNFEKIMNDNRKFFENALSVSVMLNVKETILVPREYFNESSAEEMLGLVFGEDKNTSVFKDELNGLGAVNIYRTHHKLAGMLSRQFTAAPTRHSTTVQLNCFTANDNTLHCIVYPHKLKIILFKNGKFQLAQYFSYGTPDDAVYHLLGVCGHHGIPAPVVSLQLYGLIDEKSNLYGEIYKYFAHVQFAAVPAGTQLSQEIIQYPPQFFSHLVIAATCGS